MSWTKRLVFVVGGEDVPVLCLPDETFDVARKIALNVSRNIGRPEEDWEIRAEDGRLLRPSADVRSYESPLYFLSLAVGSGGCFEARA